MKRSYLLFAKKLLFLLLILVVTDIVLGRLLEHFFLKMKVGESARITYSVDKAKEDIIIMGSSRANHHYDAKLFQDSLMRTCYNTGTDGQGVLYYSGVLKCILARHTTKTVILDFNISEFDRSQQSYNRLSYLLPYYNLHTSLQQIVNLRSPFEKIKSLSNLYRYNSCLFTILVNNVMPRQDAASNGFIPLTGAWNKPLNEVIGYKESNELDTCKIAYFKTFLEDAKREGCEVIVLVSPYFQQLTETPLSVKIAKEICERQGVRFKDYSQSPLFLQHPAYFHDVSHLNKDGAETYSKLVINMLSEDKRMLSQNLIQ